MTPSTSDAANVAIDLGATSGRVIVGAVTPDSLHFEVASRFPNTPVRVEGTLHWDVLSLWGGITTGLRKAFAGGADIASVGVDSWGVDYALLRSGRLLSNPVHYRDERTPGGADRVHRSISREEIFALNGLQFMSINSIYQLAAEHDRPFLEVADTVLMIPDLIAFWLSGVAAAEQTDASTSGLLDVSTGQWSPRLAALAGIPLEMLPGIVTAGETIGALQPSVAETVGARRAPLVTAVGSHDTASAVAAVPMQPEAAAYVSCGTWSLVGVETASPALSVEARLANFTNEIGVDDRFRVLKNVMGLWLLSETLRTWEEQDGETVQLDEALAAAEAAPATPHVFDPNDDRFMPPGDMPARIAAWYRDHGLPAPSSRAEIVRAIIESLAQSLADNSHEAGRLTGVDVRKIHIVGGGSLNELLCQRTADRSGLPVLAGPVEATAIGNLLVQARARGTIGGGLESIRELVSRTHEPRRYLPRAS